MNGSPKTLLKKVPVGMRTIKTALAVTLSLMVVEYYGASTAKVVFATIGAISAVGPTFTASLLACMTQICGVTVGALLAMGADGAPPAWNCGCRDWYYSDHHQLSPLKIEVGAGTALPGAGQYLSQPPGGGRFLFPGAHLGYRHRAGHWNAGEYSDLPL